MEKSFSVTFSPSRRTTRSKVLSLFSPSSSPTSEYIYTRSPSMDSSLSPTCKPFSPCNGQPSAKAVMVGS